MLTLSIIWVVLAGAVTCVALIRRDAGDAPNTSTAQVKESGKALAVMAVLYGSVLLAGFLCVSKFLVSSL